MTLDPKTIAQVLILSIGVHVVFSFLRATRGSGIIRGVLIALFLVFGALLGAARWFGLAELEFIVQGITGFAVVILAIVFQPELRRGIISLGDNPLLRSVIRSDSGNVVDEVAGACVAMAKRKQGALIAFEREAALDLWTQTAQRVDARVNRFLLDSIFHTGSSLHDGAVIIREDRIAVAGAILPLSESDKLAQSVGTRHRAALGLSEETDAVVVAVSEETGLITVCQNGNMERRVLRDELAGVLRARLGGGDDVDPAATGFVQRMTGGLTRFASSLGRNPMQKVLAVLFGLGLYFVAFRQVRTTVTYTVEVRAVAGEDVSGAPRPGLLRIVLPSELMHLASPPERQRLQIEASGPQAELEALGRSLGGVLEVDADWIGTEREVRASEIRWGVDRVLPGLDVRLKPAALNLLVEQYANATIDLNTTAIHDPANGRSQLTLPSNVEIVEGSLEINPASVTVRGPSDAVELIRADPTRLVFHPLDLSRETGSGFVTQLAIDQDEAEGLVLGQDLFLRGALSTRETIVGTFKADVVLVSFDQSDPLARYLPPTETVTVVVKTRGLLPDTIDSIQQTVMRQEILQFAREQARVFVDIGRVTESSTNRADVEVGDLNALWPEYLGEVFSTVKATRKASLRLEIDEPDRTVVLIQRDNGDDADD